MTNDIATVLQLIEDYAEAVHDGDDSACIVLKRTLEASLEQPASEAQAEELADSNVQVQEALGREAGGLMTEQETEMLLEAAAKSYGASHIRAGRAWGIEGRRYDGSGLLCSNGLYWNPLTDDGDALRLAGSLGLVVDCSRPSAGEPFKLHHFSQDGYQDIHAAIRRAIVRAAAEIGRNMK